MKPHHISKHTASVHAGQQRNTNQGVVNPIDPSTAFQYIDAGDQFYPRYFNTPNQSHIIEKLRQLEHAESALLFSSGMAAISTTLLALLKSGDHAVMLRGLYGGTHSFIIHELDELGVPYDFAGAEVEELIGAVRHNTRLILVESPTNPLLQIVDLQQLAGQAKQRGIITIIDNTFASPINQNPIDLGIDLVVHSGTKYLGGHSDLCFGAALGSQSLIDQIRDKAIRYGGSVNAVTCYLIERSLKTLALRVEKQNHNAKRVAQFLEEHPQVERVYYPGLTSHPGHRCAAEQMEDFGGMLSFELSESVPGRDFLDKLNLITPAMSLGGVESTATLPVFTSHRLMPDAERRRLGIGDQLVRLSVGIEDADDLIEDLGQAMLAGETRRASSIGA